MQPYPRRWQALGVLALSLLVITMGNTILNVGLPTIRAELDASSSQLQWIVDSYLLVFAGLLLAAGSLGDRFGRKRALISGLVVFGLGSILAALSTDATMLIASRALMGLGAAGIMPTTLSILTNIFPSDERQKAIAAWAAVSGIGIAVGPISGGFLIEHFSWSSIFLINLPVVATCLVGASVLVPNSRDPESPKLDLPGTGLSIAGLSAIVWALIEAPERGWGSPDDPGGLRGGGRDHRGGHRLGAPHRPPDARRQRVPQPALQRGEHLDHVRVLRAHGGHVLPHHLPAVGARLQRAGGRREDAPDRGRHDPGVEARRRPDASLRHEVLGGIRAGPRRRGARDGRDVRHGNERPADRPRARHARPGHGSRDVAGH